VNDEPLAAFIIVICLPSLASGQIAPLGGSPKAAVEQFLGLEVSGNLLTAADWKNAHSLFAHPPNSPQEDSITVIGEDYIVKEIWIRGNQAEVFASYRVVGRIDSALRYTPPDPRLVKGVVRYHLMLTSGDSDSAVTGRSPGAAAGPRGWRIQKPPSSPMIGLGAAIKYVSSERNKTADPAIKRNGDRTLTELKKLSNSVGGLL
jgi:hypothetical protein